MQFHRLTGNEALKAVGVGIGTAIVSRLIYFNIFCSDRHYWSYNERGGVWSS